MRFGQEVYGRRRRALSGSDLGVYSPARATDVVYFAYLPPGLDRRKYVTPSQLLCVIMTAVAALKLFARHSPATDDDDGFRRRITANVSYTFRNVGQIFARGVRRRPCYVHYAL